MLRNHRALWLVLIVAGLQLASCAQPAAKAAQQKPVVVEQIQDSDLSTVALTAEAAGRLGIETVAVSKKQVGGATRTVVPFAAILYDASGKTWVYTQIEDRVFIRSAVTVAEIDSEEAILSGGPPAGTLVVTTGVAELVGAEYGVGEPE